MTTREERAKERALKRKKQKLITGFTVFILIIIAVSVALGIVLNKLTPDEIETTENTTQEPTDNAEDYYNAFIARSALLYESIGENEGLEQTIRTELGDSFNATMTVFLSVSDGLSPATVVNGSAASLEGAYRAAEAKAGELVRRDLTDTVYLRADIVNSVKRINRSALVSEIASDTSGIYGEFFRRGISFDGAFNTALLEAELNAAELIDYDITKDLLLDKVNLYLTARGDKSLTALPDTLYLFTCRGYISDAGGVSELVYTPGSSYGRRAVKTVDRAYVNERLSAVCAYVANGQSEDGKFTYGMYPLQGLPIESYSVGAHAAMISALLSDSKLLDTAGLNDAVITSAVDYLKAQIVEKDANTAFAADLADCKLTAGGTARAIVALCDYAEAKSDKPSEALAEKLGNGLISMIDPATGRLNHELFYHSDGAVDFTVRTAQTDRVYDSVSAYALARLYGASKNESYLNAARTLTNVLIRENYTQYCDAYVSLAAEEMTKYDGNVEYYNLALRNFNENINDIEARIISNPTYTRLLLSTYRVYSAMQAASVQTELFNTFDRERLALATVARAEDLLNGIVYPETAMYFRSPDSCINAFCTRQDGFRIRIDDTASFIEAYAAYSESYTTVSADAFAIQSKRATAQS